MTVPAPVFDPAKYKVTTRKQWQEAAEQGRRRPIGAEPPRDEEALGSHDGRRSLPLRVGLPRLPALDDGPVDDDPPVGVPVAQEAEAAREQGQGEGPPQPDGQDLEWHHGHGEAPGRPGLSAGCLGSGP